MKLSDLKNHDTIVRERRETDLAYVATTERLKLADAVSQAVVHYRSRHHLTQTEFGFLLGWKQPRVARLERGDIAPSIETLQRLERLIPDAGRVGEDVGKNQR